MKEKWMIDSASTFHMYNIEKKIESLFKKPRIPVEAGKGQLVDVPGTENCLCKKHDWGNKAEYDDENCLKGSYGDVKFNFQSSGHVIPGSK